MTGRPTSCSTIGGLPIRVRRPPSPESRVTPRGGDFGSGWARCGRLQWRSPAGHPGQAPTARQGRSTKEILQQGVFADSSSVSAMLSGESLPHRVRRSDARSWPMTVVCTSRPPMVRRSSPGSLDSYAMPCRLYLVRPGGQFRDVSEQSVRPGPLLTWEGDSPPADQETPPGWSTWSVVCQDEPLVYLHNRTRRPGRFVVFQLEGAASNRDGIGAARRSPGAADQVRTRMGGGSYLAACDRKGSFRTGADKLARHGHGSTGPPVEGIDGNPGPTRTPSAREVRRRSRSRDSEVRAPPKVALPAGATGPISAARWIPGLSCRLYRQEEPLIQRVPSSPQD